MNGWTTHCKRGHEFTPETTVRHGRSRDGKPPPRRCLICQRARERAWYERSQFAAPAAAELVCWSCGEGKPLHDFYPSVARQGRGRCRACAPRATRAATLRQYGLSQDGYQALLAAQGFACACCLSDDPGGPVAMFKVDHDHETGRVRGLLCNSCNLAIGMLGDSAAGVRRALAYLERADARASAECT